MTSRRAGVSGEPGASGFRAIDHRGQLVIVEQLAGTVDRGEHPHPPALDQLGMAHANSYELSILVEEAASGSAVFGDLGGDQEGPILAALIQLEPEDLDEPGLPARELGTQ